MATLERQIWALDLAAALLRSDMDMGGPLIPWEGDSREYQFRKQAMDDVIRDLEQRVKELKKQAS